MGSFGPVLAGDWTANGFIYKPSLGARGTVEKNRYDSGQDRVDARLNKEIWVGDPNYGTTIQDALTVIGSNQAILRVPAGPHSISGNLIVPSNVTLRVERRATLAIPQGVTLTINGGLDAGFYQIFSCIGTGKVVFGTGIKEIYPQWWGAAVDASTDDSVPVQAAMTACPAGSSVIFTGISGVGYSGWTGLVLTSKSGVTLKGNVRGTGLKILALPTQGNSSAGVPTAIKFVSSDQMRVVNLEIDGNGLSLGHLCFDHCTNSTAQKNYIHNSSTHTDFNEAGIWAIGGFYNEFLENRIVGGGRGMWIGNCGVVGEQETYCSIKGNRISGTSATAIGGTLWNSIITENACLTSGGSGISLGSTDTVIYKNVTISNNYCAGNAYQGIQSDVVPTTPGTMTANTQGVSAIGNTCVGNTQNGIYAYNASHWSITGNIVKNNGSGNGGGILLGVASDIIIQGNTITDDQVSPTQYRGINATCDYTNGLLNIIISNNSISNHLASGIFFIGAGGSGSNISIKNNISTNNYTGIQVQAGFTNVDISNNIASGNADTQFRLDSVNARGLNNIGAFYFTGGAKMFSPMEGLSTYTNNTAALAGGLAAGDLYQTSTGQVMVVY